MVIIDSLVSLLFIKENHNHFFGTMIKFVVDIEKEIMAFDADLHADLEGILLESGSNQSNLWGANIYFENPGEIEFTSLINIRPSQNNKSMEVQDEKIKQKNVAIYNRLITR